MDKFEVWRKFVRDRWWSFDAEAEDKARFAATGAWSPEELKSRILRMKTWMLIRLDRAERKHFA